MNFTKWINTFLDEKGIDGEQVIEARLNGENHFLPIEILVNFMVELPAEMQAQIKNTFVQIDFKNGDVMHYMNHLARGYVRAAYYGA